MNSYVDLSYNVLTFVAAKVNYFSYMVKIEEMLDTNLEHFFNKKAIFNKKKYCIS